MAWGKGRNKQRRGIRQLRFSALESRIVLTANPTPLGDLSPGANSSYPNSFVELNGELYFAASTNTQSLWVTDGTPGGTSAINTGLQQIEDLTKFGNKLAFFGYSGAGWGLYTSDGTPGGTQLVQSVQNPQQLIASGGKLFFTDASNTYPYNTYRVWGSDGTPGGTSQLAQFSNYNPGTLVGIGGQVSFFEYNPSTNTYDLWTSDGTIPNTIDTGVTTQGGPNLIAFGNELYYGGYSGSQWQLLKTDGTVGGTSVVANLDSSPFDLVSTQNQLFFAVYGPDGIVLYSSDGTPAGTTAVVPGITSITGQLITSGNQVIFEGYDPLHGWEPWVSDGTVSGSHLIENIGPGTLDGASYANMFSADGVVVFTADDGAHGEELWKTDGTAAGTSEVTDLQPGPPSSMPGYQMGEINGKLIFWANDGVHGYEPYALPIQNQPPTIGTSGSPLGVPVNTAVPVPPITIGDPDAQGNETVQLQVGNGTLSATAAGAASVTGNGSGTLQIVGSLADVQNTLNSLTYTPGAGFVGTDTLTASITDTSNTVEGPQTATATLQLNVTAQAPNLALATQSPGGNVNAPVSIGSFTLADPNAGVNTMSLDVQVSAGTLTVGTTPASVTVTGSGDHLVLSGTNDADLLTALNSITDESALPTSVHVTVAATVLGNTTTVNSQFNINAVPAAPDIDAANSTFTTTTNTLLPLTGLLVVDNDQPSGQVLTVQVQTSLGTLTAAGPGASGSGTNTVTFVGTQSDINTELATLGFESATGGVAAITVTATEPLANDQNSVTLHVNVNTAVAINAPSTITIPFNGTANLGGLSVTDQSANPGNNPISVVIGGAGTLTASGVGVSGSGSNQITIAGNQAQVNTALATLTFKPTMGAAGGLSTVSISATENGQTALGSVYVQVQADVAPTITAPASVTTTVTSSHAVSGVSISDSDATSETVMLSVAHGTLSGVAGAGVTVTPLGAGALEVHGSLAAVNTALAGLTYTPSGTFVGTDVLSITATDDAGVSGTGAVNVNVQAVASAPTLVAGTTTFTATAGVPVALNGLSVVDNDQPAGGILTVTLASSAGTLTAAGAAVFSGSGTATLVLKGSQSQINAALNTLDFASATGVAATITVNAREPISNLAATPLTLHVNVDAPVAINTPSTITIPFNGTATIAGLSVTDQSANAGTNPISLTLSGVGTLTATGAGVTGSGSNQITIAGTQAQINTALATLTFKPTMGAAGGLSTLAISATELGLTSNGSVGVQVLADVAPIVTAPVSLSTSVISGLAVTGVSIADSDATTETVILSVAHGTLSGVAGAGVTVTPLGAGAVQVQGLLAAVNTALGGLTYTPSGTFVGTDVLSITATDNGGVTGTGSVSIHVTAVANAPTLNAATTTFTADAGVPIALNGLSVTDNDQPPGGVLTVTVVSNAGTLTATGAGVVSGSGTASLTLTGTQSQINTALNTLGFEAAAGGTATITVNAREPLSNLTATPQTLHVNVDTVVAINTPGPISIPFGGSANIAGLSVTDQSANPGNNLISVTISGPGTLTASGAGVTGSGSSLITISGNQAQVNAELATLNFTPTPVAAGANLALAITATENNLTSLGSVSVIALADVAPTINAPASIATTVASGAQLIGNLFITDPDAGTETVTLSVTHGTLGGVSGAGVVVLAPTVVQISGTVSAVNAALAGLTYSPDPTLVGTDALQISAVDNGGASSAAQVDITINAAGVPPTVHLPVTTPPVPAGGAPVAIAGVSVTNNDLPAGAGTLSVTISAAPGIALFAPGATGGGSNSLTVTGTQASVNLALANLTMTAGSSVSAGTYHISVLATESIAGHTTPSGFNVAVTTGPQLAGLPPATISYRAGARALSVMPAVTVSAGSAGSFAGGQLTLALTNAKPTDRLAVKAGAGVRLLPHHLISVNGVIIGTYLENATSLTVSLTAQATAANIQALLRAMTFNTTRLGGVVRQVAVSLTDGSSPVAGTGTVSIAVVR